MIKTAAELLQVAALRTRTITVRDAEVRIRELSVRARQEFIQIAPRGVDKVGPWLVQMGVVDDDGKPFISEDEAKILADTSAEVVEAIANVVLELSGLKDAEKKD